MGLKEKLIDTARLTKLSAATRGSTVGVTTSAINRRCDRIHSTCLSMSLGKRKTLETGDNEDEVMIEKRRRDFERSLAGPSVGKAGLKRDQTGGWCA